MIIDLGKFMTLWLLVIITFTMVGSLLFGGLPDFHDMGDVFVMFFEASLGSWNNGVFKKENEEGEVNNITKWMGIIYLLIFLMINLILMLNLVIAILANTYSAYDVISSGLYYGVLIDMFTIAEWDSKWGSLVCAQTPFNVFLPLAMPVLAITERTNPDNLETINNRIAMMLYMPTALSVTIVFTVSNTVIAPFAYIWKIFMLADDAVKQTSLTNFVQKVCNILQFMTVGILVLIISILVDPIIFFLNLYNEPKKDTIKEEGKSLNKLTYNGI